MIKSNIDLKIPLKIWNSEWIKFELNVGVCENIISFFSKKTLSGEVNFITEIKLDHTKIPKKLENDKNQIWDFSRINKFQLNIGEYADIVSFFVKNNIYFLAEMNLDYVKIPKELHGNGVSRNLIEYFENNREDKSLIINFTNYFMSTLIDMRNINDEKINFSFLKSESWNKSSSEEILFWNWNLSKWVKFRPITKEYVNIIDFFTKNNIYFVTEMNLDYKNLPKKFISNSKNLLEYITNPRNSNELIIQFLNYFIVSLLDIRYNNNKLRYNFLQSSTWKDSKFEIFDIPTIQAYEEILTTTTTTTTIRLRPQKPKYLSKPALIPKKEPVPIIISPILINVPAPAKVFEEYVKPVKTTTIPIIKTTTSSTTTTTTTLAKMNSISLRFNAFTSKNACTGLQSDYSILENDFVSATAIYYYNTDYLAQNGFYSDGIYCREWNGINLSEPILCIRN